MSNFLQKIFTKLDTLIQYPKLISTLTNKISREFCKELLFLKKKRGFNFSNVIDVGAAMGEYSKAAHFIFPDAKIFAFEPIPDSFEKLKIVAGKIKNMQCFELALSDHDGVEEFHLNEFSYSSSLLKMTEMHKTVYPFTRTDSSIKVRTNKLDNILANIISGTTLLKIDVQGNELKVLKGATNLLNEITVIQLEVGFQNFYEEQTSAEELINFLKSFGFNAFLQIDPVFQQNKLTYSDLIFWKNQK